MLPRVHIAVWLGLGINTFLVALTYLSFQDLPRAAFSAEELAVIDMVSQVLPFLWGIIALQAVGAYFVGLGERIGLGIACIGALLMMPISLIYLLGCLYSYGRKRNEGLMMLDKKALQDLRTRRSVKSYVSQYGTYLVYATVGFACLSQILFMMHEVNFLMLFLGLAVVAAYLAYRQMYTPALLIGEQGLSVSSSLLSMAFFLPYEQLHSAQLMPQECIEFVVRTRQGEKKILWTLRSIKPVERKAAFTALAEVLRQHYVQLL